MSDHSAKGSLERWCQAFGPCPANLQQAVARMHSFSTSIETRGNYRILRMGFLGGRWYAFEHDRLVGAEAWDDVSFGACAERGVVVYGAGLAFPPSERGASCGVVPTRDYTNGEPCRCDVKGQMRFPSLTNGNRGPTLRTSLECLYEAGVTAYLCQPTLQVQRELMRVHGQSASTFRSSERTKCGDTVVSWPFQGAGAECRYDAEGTLRGVRWGKRYESEGFSTCAR